MIYKRGRKLRLFMIIWLKYQKRKVLVRIDGHLKLINYFEFKKDE